MFYRSFFLSKQTLVSSLFSNFALVKRFRRNIDSKKVGCAETFVHDIVGKNKAFAIISRSAKSLGNLLDGNNVTEIIVIRHSVWNVLTYMYNRNASRHRRGVFFIMWVEVSIPRLPHS